MMTKLLILFLARLVFSHPFPHGGQPSNHVHSQDNTWNPQVESPDSSLYGVNSTNSSDSSGSPAYVQETAQEDQKPCLGQLIWYYLFPALVYICLAVLVLVVLVLIWNLCFCVRTYCSCDMNFCHRTTVAEEKRPDCGKKDKLQFSLVNVNKHYYRLDGQDVP